jgi:NADPH:quinone reductase-like Zn-dependent oxidoreductase
MKAAVINHWGSPDVFEIKDLNKPVIQPNQLMIRVFASSVNPADYKHRLGNHRYIFGAPFPIILGYDVCGEVVKVGSKITRFQVGEIVFGDLDNKYGGALAEYAIGHEKCFAIKPYNITDEQAAAFPLVSLTALQALRDKANLTKNQTILINGASGGVGHIAVQIAKLLGARAIAVASSKNEEFIKSLNPYKFIDYTSNDILKFDGKVDVFFDTIGNYSFRKTRHLLESNGTYISTLPRLKVLLHKIYQSFSKGKKVKTLIRKHSSEDLDLIAKWIAEGCLKVFIDRVFKLDEISEAHKYMETGRTKGKNVIVIK